MQKSISNRFVLMALAFSFCAVGVRAQTNSLAASGDGFSLDDNFRPGWREFSLGVSPMFSPLGNDFNRPVVNWVEGFAQLGYMVTDIHGNQFLGGFFRGNFEAVGEAFGAGIWEETGHYIAGGSILGRYNFIPRASRFSPYVQAGVGGEMMDINHQYDGHNFNFNVDASGGIRYFLKPGLSLNVECRFQHLSNADTADRNIGINAIGPVIGLSWFF
jgi:opacity protein-like surface antigen